MAVIEDEGGRAIDLDELAHDNETSYLQGTQYLQLNNFTSFSDQPTVLWKSSTTLSHLQ